MKRTFGFAFLGVALLCSGLSGCGAGGGCTPTGFSLDAVPFDLNPATPDHTAPPPGNQAQFTAHAGPVTGPGCATPALLFTAPAMWSSSDVDNVQISSAKDATNGLATCKGATSGTVTLTAVYSQGGFTETATAAILCK